MRDGFSFWAFLLGPLWMLWHRMWLVLIGYLAVTIGLQALLRVLDASQAAMAAVGLVISIPGRTRGEHAAPLHAAPQAVE